MNTPGTLCEKDSSDQGVSTPWSELLFSLCVLTGFVSWKLNMDYLPLEKDACLAYHGKSAPFPIFHGQLRFFVY